MMSGTNSSSDPGSKDPYTTLGLPKSATFEEIQKARERLLNEAGDDSLAKAKIESSYDALLMVSLKERQLGKVSNAAVNASKKEDGKINDKATINNSLLSKIKGFNPGKTENSNNTILPNLALPEGQGLTIRIALGILALVLTLVSPKESIQVILSLAMVKPKII